ncbi:hypothetical protein EDB81DRAFT_671724 [Dactylonectria macrodidyma]|uniref:Rhodopsin domain-containing protein n=1 Tax=Dactylonectria macrodidyma TaxID=307937 RepID=A0A9P9I7Q0_9HYPO|nr:hypothetical protein EDB81DRAFT_671724 [Dactylonectria macrodidyma]
MWYIADIPIVERNHGLIISGFLFTTIAFIAVGLRIFTRTVLVSNMGLDDYVVIAAMLGSVAFLTGTLHQVKYGLGDAVIPSMIHQFFQALLATIIAYSFTQLAVKFSILLQCKRIFSSTSARRLFTGLIIWLAIYGLFCLFSSIVTCVPIAKYWDETIPGGCINRSTLQKVLAGFNIVNDLALLVAPLPFLKNLHIARRAKLILIGVFGCGGVACIVAVIRLQSLFEFNSAPIGQQPIKGVDIALWSGLEINIAIVCASVPALKPLFVRAFPRLISSFTDSSKRSRRPTHNQSTHGILPLDSVDRRHPGAIHSEDNMAIQVRQSFEMKAISGRDDSSDKNLVQGPESSTWTTECYAGH